MIPAMIKKGRFRFVGRKVGWGS